MKLLVITQKVDRNDQLLGFFVNWLNRLSDKFERMTVLCLEKGDFSLSDNVTVISLGKERHLPKLAWLFNFYRFIFQLRKDYDAVLVHMNPIWMVLGGICWRLMGKKNYLWYTSGGVTFKLKLAEKFTHVVLTASPESFRVFSQKVVITGHGIDTDLFKPAANPQEKSGRLKILSVGRIAPVKNYEVLIEAAKTLRERGFDFGVNMIGEAPTEKDRIYERKVKNSIKNLKLESYFVFLGKINIQKLPFYYQTHDLFVHLSKTGSLDKSLLEAMASGIRVLSSNDWSRRHLPPELVFGENDPIELADKIENIFRTDFRKKLRDLVVAGHNLDNLIEKISAVIKK